MLVRISTNRRNKHEMVTRIIFVVHCDVKQILHFNVIHVLKLNIIHVFKSAMILGEKLGDHRQILSEDFFCFFREQFFSDKN